MSIIVVDASAVLAVVLREGTADQIKDRTSGYELISPESLPMEVANALALGLIQSGGHKPKMPLAAWEAFRQYRLMQIRLIQMDDRMYQRVLDLSHRHGMYAYDAFMLAMAERYRARLLTLDGFTAKKKDKPGLKQHAEAEGIEVIPLKVGGR